MYADTAIMQGTVFEQRKATAMATAGTTVTIILGVGVCEGKGTGGLGGGVGGEGGTGGVWRWVGG